MSQPKSKPCCQSARVWLKLRRGKCCLGVFTGGTSRVFSAYLHLVEVWLSNQSDEAVAALRATAKMMQRSEWSLAAEAIAHLGDWSHIEQLWSQIRPEGAPMFAHVATTDQVIMLKESEARS